LPAFSGTDRQPDHRGPATVAVAEHEANPGVERDPLAPDPRAGETEHAAVVADLITRGLAVAETDFFCDFVWVTNADGIEVYDSECKVLHAAGDRATFADGRVVARADIACVFAFAEDDYIYRGVKALLRSGEELRLVTEASGSAMADPTYSRNELLWETGWTADIGRAIAKWAGAPFEYRV
jgi:hypothetical protein